MVSTKYVQKAIKTVKIKCKNLEIMLDYGNIGGYNINEVLMGRQMRIIDGT
jgi:hypothetical protein